MIRAAALAVVFAVSAFPSRVQATELDVLYRNASPKLRASAVPVLLPRRLPRELGPVRAVSVMSTDKSGYYVGYSSQADCNGALSCAHVHVAGYAASSVPDYGRGRRLHLSDGTLAYYLARDCSGASCTEASLAFKRGRAVYELDAEVAVKDDLPILKTLYENLRSNSLWARSYRAPGR